MVAFIVSSGTLLDAAEQLSPMRPKKCHNEGITSGMCHDCLYHYYQRCNSHEQSTTVLNMQV